MNCTMCWASGCLLAAAALLSASGCQSDSHTAQGGIFGGLLGAGTGALIGAKSGHAVEGAAIGAGAGALAGAAIGSAQDQAEARNRALIEAQLGRRIGPGSVTTGEVLNMAQAHVNDDLIINHIRAHGMVAPPNANELIALQQNGVSPRVVQAMQEAPPPQPVVVQQAPPPVIVEGGYYDRPYYYPHRRYYW